MEKIIFCIYICHRGIVLFVHGQIIKHNGIIPDLIGKGTVLGAAVEFCEGQLGHIQLQKLLNFLETLFVQVAILFHIGLAEHSLSLLGIGGVVLSAIGKHIHKLAVAAHLNIQRQYRKLQLTILGRDLFIDHIFPEGRRILGRIAGIIIGRCFIIAPKHFVEMVAVKNIRAFHNRLGRLCGRGGRLGGRLGRIGGGCFSFLFATAGKRRQQKH